MSNIYDFMQKAKQYHQSNQDEVILPDTYKDMKVMLNCLKCIEELPADESPRDYGRLEVGLLKDKKTIRVHCQREGHGVVGEWVLKNPPDAKCDCEEHDE